MAIDWTKWLPPASITNEETTEFVVGQVIGFTSLAWKSAQRFVCTVRRVGELELSVVLLASADSSHWVVGDTGVIGHSYYKQIISIQHPLQPEPTDPDI